MNIFQKGFYIFISNQKIIYLGTQILIVLESVFDAILGLESIFLLGLFILFGGIRVFPQ